MELPPDVDDMSDRLKDECGCTDERDNKLGVVGDPPNEDCG